MTGWPLALAIVGALSGLAAAGLSGATLWVTGRRETQKWLRDSLLDAQIDFLDASFEYPSRRLYEFLSQLASSDEPDIATFIDEYRAAHTRQNDALSRIRLLANDDVVKASEALHTVDEHVAVRLLQHRDDFPNAHECAIMRADKRAARERFIKAARNILKLSDGAPIS